MRRRVLTTTKILAVALAATPACTKPEVRADPPATSAPAPVTPSATPSAAGSARPEDPKLTALRDELAGMKRDQAFGNARFQPLCDKDGYPLVGNLSRKAPDQGPEVSEFCADVRKKKGH